MSRARLSQRARERLELSALLVAGLLFHSFALLRFPPPFVDEPWFASRAWALIQIGRPVGSLDSGVVERFSGYWTAFPFFLPWVQSLAMRALGLSLFSTRVTSLVFGLFLLVAVYVIANRLYGHRTALLSALLVSVSQSFLASSHLGRPDVIVSALGWTAIALYLVDASAGFSLKAVCSGLLIVLAFDAHMNAVLYGFVIGVLYLVDLRLAVVRSRRFWSFAVGVAVGLGVYAWIHILPYPETYYALTSPSITGWRPPPLLTMDAGVWLSSAVDTIFLLVWSNGPDAVIVVGTAFALLRRRTASDRRLLAIFAVLFVVMTLLIRYKLQFYGIIISPAVDIMVAFLLVRMASRTWDGSIRAFLGSALVVGLVVASVFVNLRSVVYDPMPDYTATLDAIRQVVPAGAIVLGTQTYWYGLPDHRYLSPETLTGYQQFTPGASLADALSALRPDFLILDHHSDQFTAYSREDLPEYFRFVYLDKTELDSFLAKRGSLATAIYTPTFGDVRVYKIDWTTP